MKKMLFTITMMMVMLSFSVDSFAQGPKGKDFGFGIIFGDPLGLTMKFWTTSENAFDVYIGSSYFGNLRVGADYLWHFDAFNSSVVKMYAGVGGVVGFGNGHGIWYKENKDKFYYWNDNDIGIGARALLGINIIPRRTPLEFFIEIGPLVGLVPNYGVNVDAAAGIRFYP